MAVFPIDNPLKASKAGVHTDSNGKATVLPEAVFQQILVRERKRSERSKRPLLLMLIESRDQNAAPERAHELSRLLEPLLPKIRETDVIGWYRTNAAIGVIFTELSADDKGVVLSAVLDRFSATLHARLPVGSLAQVFLSFHFFPDDWGELSPVGGSNDMALYPDIQASTKRKTLMLGIKRAMDIVIASLMLLICSPLFLVIGAGVKATSRGPVFFKQRRVGQYGRHFTFLKFRSMQVDNDCSVHRDYVSQLIAGNAARISTDDTADGVYKLTSDRRITPLGKLLRQSSLDELPQFINVLRGEMSLVGPRPPIPYELAVYQTWHRRRLLQVKPGITGLWQVNGRNRIGFDDMVRCDLQYASTWSPWLDLKIMLQTPAAVLKGAY